MHALAVAILAGVVSIGIVQAAKVPSERWTLTTIAGTATLAFVTEPEGRPLIIFVCGARMPGVAQVIVPMPEDDLGDRRLRLDLEVGKASVMAAALRTSGVLSDRPAITSEITAQEMTALLLSPSDSLSWRVETSSSAGRPRLTAPLPHPISRQRTEFLRFCA
jgi:hypothetical protein